MTASRRDFLKLAGAASVAAIAFRDALCRSLSLGLLLGLQLTAATCAHRFRRNLRPLPPQDTPKPSLGYYAMSAQDFKQSMDTAGLHCVSAHLLSCCNRNWSRSSYAKELGLQSLRAPLPLLRTSRVRLTPGDRLSRRLGRPRSMIGSEIRAVQPDRAKVMVMACASGHHNHTNRS